MSRLTLCGECEALLEQTTLTLQDLARMQLEAARHSFLPPPIKAAVIERVSAYCAALPAA
jgi:hypothetical protein